MQELKTPSFKSLQDTFIQRNSHANTYFHRIQGKCGAFSSIRTNDGLSVSISEYMI